MSPCLTLYDKIVRRYEQKCVKNCPKTNILLDFPANSYKEGLKIVINIVNLKLLICKWSK